MTEIGSTAKYLDRCADRIKMLTGINFKSSSEHPQLCGIWNVWNIQQLLNIYIGEPNEG